MKPIHLIPLTPLLLATAGVSALPAEYKDFYGEVFTPSCIAEALRTDAAMTIDGLGNEAVWASAPSYVFDKVTWPVPSGLGWNDPVNGTPVSADDLSATFQAAWDDQYLYLLVKVTDDAIVIDGTDSGYEKDDALEIYLDGDNSRDIGTNWNAPGYDFINDRQLKIKADNDTVPVGGLYDVTENGTVIVPQDIVIERRFVETDTGYNLEIRMNFSGIFRDAAGDGSLVQQPAVDAYLGFDMKLADDDDGGDRDITYGWCADSNNNYADPSIFGTLVLTGGGTTPGYELTVGVDNVDPLYGTVYGLSTLWGASDVLGFIHVTLFPDAVYSQKLGWLFAPYGDASTGLFYYSVTTSNWIWVTAAYPGYAWDYASGSWGPVY